MQSAWSNYTNFGSDIGIFNSYFQLEIIFLSQTEVATLPVMTVLLEEAKVYFKLKFKLKKCLSVGRNGEPSVL